MKIGIVGPFNPYTVFDYLTEESKLKVKPINDSATSINVLVKSLLEADQNIVVVTSDFWTSSNIVLSGEQITIHIVGLKKMNRFLTYFSPLFIKTRRIETCIDKELSSIDILHAQWTYYFAYASAKFVNKVPVVCTIRDWAPYIYTCISKFHLKLFWITQMITSKMVINNSKIHFIANSYYTQQQILNLHPEYNIPIVFNSIEDSYILKERENYPQQYTFISISPSIEDKRKNCDKLLQAFSLLHHQYPGAKLIMIGKINFNATLYKKWKEQGLVQNVDFLGYIDHTRLMEILDNVSCLVHPSLEETFGNILLEGMSRRVPIIGGESSGAVPDVLKQGKCGCLCDVTNPKSITDAMLKVIENPTYTKSIINNATTVLLNEYCSSVVAQKHIQIYKSLIKFNNIQ